MKRVVIVGGGYAGTLLARALDPIAEVVLIEPKAAFVHNVARYSRRRRSRLVGQVDSTF